MEALQRFLPDTRLAMPQVPTLLPGEARPMGEFPNGGNAVPLQ
jgi:hypothetical protein